MTIRIADDFQSIGARLREIEQTKNIPSASCEDCDRIGFIFRADTGRWALCESCYNPQDRPMPSCAEDLTF